MSLPITKCKDDICAVTYLASISVICRSKSVGHLRIDWEYLVLFDPYWSNIVVFYCLGKGLSESEIGGLWESTYRSGLTPFDQGRVKSKNASAIWAAARLYPGTGAPDSCGTRIIER